MVNGEPITQQEVNFALAPQLQELQAGRDRLSFEAALNEARTETLNDLIDNKLIIQEFNRRGAEIPDRAIDEEIERIIRTRFNGDRGKFAKDLEQSNLTQAGFRRVIRDQIIVREMRRVVLGLPDPPSPEDVQRAYREHDDQFRSEDFVLYRNLFVPLTSSVPGVTPESQRALIDDIRRQVIGGGDFAELARQHSSLTNAPDGGANPQRGSTEMVEWSREPIFSTPVGQVSPVVTRPEGYFLYYIENVQRGTKPPIDEIRDQLENIVREESQQIEYEEWMTRLRNQAQIRTN